MDIEQLSDEEYLALPEPRPHRFPGREPSDSCYCGISANGVLRKCRCQLCREAHNATTRKRQQAQRAGLWVDGRRAIRTNAFLNELIELAGRAPELYALLRKHGHVPPVIRVQPDPVIAGELPPGAPEAVDSPDPVSSREPAQEPQTDPGEGTEQQTPAEAVTEAFRAADDRVLKYLEMSTVPGGNGKLNPNLLGMMPTVLQMSSEHCQAALDKLESAGLLAGDGTDIYLVAA